MEANALANGQGIDPQRLRPGDYFASLTEEALACGLLTEDDLARLQAQLPGLLRRMAAEYAGEGCGSLPVETAGEMLRSLQFAIGAALKGYAASEQAAIALKERPLNELYDEGLCRVRQKLRTVRLLQRRILSRLFQPPNGFWRSTIEGGVNGFFRLYRPEFAAHEIHITADYPPLLGRPALQGVEFMERYLQEIDGENAFLRTFPPRAVHRLLLDLSREYASAPVNLFEPVCLSALGLTLCGRSPLALDLTPDEVEKLARDFENRTMIRPALENALNRLGDRKGLEQSIISLSRLYRYTCEHNFNSTIQHEFNFIKDYLYLQKTRFDERLDFQIFIEPGLEDFEIPKFLVQPLIENAIVHGLEPSDRNELIQLSAFTTKSRNGEDFTVITVINSGLPYIENKSYKRVGLKNIEERLTIFSPNSFFIIRGGIDKPTKCTIMIPKPHTEKGK